MATMTISEEKFNKVLADVENLIEDVTDLLGQDKIAKERIADIEADPPIGKTEKELDSYLQKRGVRIG